MGVVLSGLLDDGTAGLRAVKTCGGVAVVQDPRDAPYPDMPTSALQEVAVDHRLPVAELAALLERLAWEPVVVPNNGTPIPDDLKFEAAMVEWDLDSLEGNGRPGKPSPFVCPNCKGSLWETEDGDQFRYRCRTGHAFSPLSLLTSQAEALDETLNEAFRALKEKHHLSLRLARRARTGRNPGYRAL